MLAGLAPPWVAGARGAGIVFQLAKPYAPPQGALDPALQAFLEGKRDAALLTREVAEADLATFRAYHDGQEPVVLPVAAGAWDRFGYVDAVVIIVNRANPVPALSFTQLDAVFSTTRWRGGHAMTSWGDLGLSGMWRDRPVRLAGGGAWSAEESARALTVRRRILSVGDRIGRWQPAADSGGETEVVARVAADPAAIGFTGMGHLSPGVRAVPLVVGGHPVAADARTAALGAYPLLRTIDLLLPTDGAGHLAAPSTRLATWLLSKQGQSIVADQGDFAPLPKRERRRTRMLLHRAGQRSQPC